MSQPIAVLVKRFPKLSETFVQGEIASLMDGGVDLQIISLHRPNEELQQPGIEQFEQHISYVEDQPELYSCLRLIKALFRRPRSALPALRKLFAKEVRWTELAGVLRICEMSGVTKIHAHCISEPALIADLVCQLLGGTFSVSAHAKDIYLTPGDTVKNRLRNASFVSTCTEHNLDHLRALAEDSGNIHLVYHGIDSERFKPAIDSIATNRPLIVAVGRYKEKKGFDLLVRACERLLHGNVDFRCEIIGYGDQRSELVRLINSNWLQDHVYLRPPVNHDELVGILQNAAVCVYPCRQTGDGDRDGIPNSLLEAMACGVPIVSTPVSGIPEVVRSGWNGLLVEPEDFDALADAIASLLDDARLSRQFGILGRQTVRQKFCWQKILFT